MMKKLLSIVAVLALAGVAGCGITERLKTGKVDPAMSQPELQAQALVNEARRVLIDADKLIGESVALDIWTPDEGQQFLVQARTARIRLDDAQKLIAAKEFQKAMTEAGAIQILADGLLKQAIIARNRAKAKPPGAQLELLLQSA